MKRFHLRCHLKPDVDESTQDNRKFSHGETQAARQNTRKQRQTELTAGRGLEPRPLQQDSHVMLACTYMIMFVLFMAFGYTMLLSAKNLTERESQVFGNDANHFL